MSIYYSPSTNSFWDEIVHGNRTIDAPLSEREVKAGKRAQKIVNPHCKIPEDAAPISDQKYTDLMQALNKGGTLSSSKGQPIARPAVQSPDERISANRRLRDKMLRDSDWTQLPDTLGDQPEVKVGWQAYRHALRDLDLDAPEWPSAPGAGENEEEE